MEISRQKKTVRVAATRPSVKKGRLLSNARLLSGDSLQGPAEIRRRTNLENFRDALNVAFPLQAIFQILLFCSPVPKKTPGVFYLLSFLPQTEAVC